MRNKNIVIVLSFIIFTAAVVITALAPEKEFFHVWYETAVIAVIMLSMFMQAKDTVIIVLLMSCVVWGMGFFEVVSQLHQLIAETAILIAATCALGWYEVGYNNEKKQQEIIVSYKKREIDALREKIQGMNRENQAILDETKKIKKVFVP